MPENAEVCHMASCVCSVTVSFASLPGGIEAFWGNAWRGGERISLLCADMVSLALSWTSSVLLEMPGVRDVRKVKAIQCCRDTWRARHVCLMLHPSNVQVSHRK